MENSSLSKKMDGVSGIAGKYPFTGKPPHSEEPPNCKHSSVPEIRERAYCTVLSVRLMADAKTDSVLVNAYAGKGVSSTYEAVFDTIPVALVNPLQFF